MYAPIWVFSTECQIKGSKNEDLNSRDKKKRQRGTEREEEIEKESRDEEKERGVMMMQGKEERKRKKSKVDTVWYGTYGTIHGRLSVHSGRHETVVVSLDI